MATEVTVEILGIRHHGPGSARSVRRALDQLQPSSVVIEGPPELDVLVPFAGDPGLVPPVAGLVYDVKEPRHASFYPLAVFSPEWVALQWAVANGATVQFADLPAANGLAVPADDTKNDHAEATTDADTEQDGVAEQDDTAELDDTTELAERIDERVDPIGALAAAAGYDDAERWWEDAIEQRSSTGDPLEQFAAVRMAMTHFRDSTEERLDDPPGQQRLLQREASMRKILRKVVKAADGPVAFVCGAFHAPVLHPDDWPSATSDNALLKGLPKTKVAATWAPWTSARLAYRSGYGAGVAAPRWYEHLFAVTDDVIAHWMVETARVLRDEGYDASAASAVEATRLAATLASLRGRPLAGLAEVSDAAVAVLGHGSSAALHSVSNRLFVGTTLGTVPETTPLVPLAADLAKQQRSMRLKVSAEQKLITVDLRQDSQLARSVLFRRLNLLGIHWATETHAGRTGGTFKEMWQLEWQPEFAIAVIEASLFGTTIQSAASAKVIERSREADSLQVLAGLVETCLLAELPYALAQVLEVMAAKTAVAPDQLALMLAVEPLARTQRYGNVRDTDTSAVQAVVSTMVTRASIGLSIACVSLDDDAAAAMRAAIESVERGVTLIEDDALLTSWRDALASLSTASVHGSVGGAVTRILLDSGRIEIDEASRRLGRALSLVHAPGDAAAWLDGFLAGDVALLLHDPQVFGLIDSWLCDLDDTQFEDLLPLIRRTFSRFEKAERRQLGELISRGPVSAEVTDGQAIPQRDGATSMTRDRTTRWRLVLGGDQADGIVTAGGDAVGLTAEDAARDKALAELYDGTGKTRGGMGGSAPRVAKWLGDIRTYFPSSVVQVLQRDAMDRLGLRHLLLEPEMLEAVEPDMSMVTTLIGLGQAIPESSKQTARAIVRSVTKQLEEQLAAKTRQSISGALDRSARTRRPKPADIDWNRTIAANLRNYLPEHKTVVPERLVGYGRRSTQVQRDIILCIDQSGSMASSIVYSSVFGAVMASIKSVKTRMVVFDTEVVDLTEEIEDPVDVLFGVQLGGGTDINRAIAYCQDHISNPTDTVFVLISDLYEGGIEDEMLRRAREMVDQGVTVIALLALTDTGAPSYDANHAAKLCALGVPAFACTPDLFPDLMAAAIERRDLSRWAAANDVPLAVGEEQADALL